MSGNTQAKRGRNQSIQKEASKYVLSICDLCVRAKLVEECEDYDLADERRCPEVFCVFYRKTIPRGEMRHRAGWKTECSMYAPDIQRIRSVMAHSALRHAREMEALDALIQG